MTEVQKRPGNPESGAVFAEAAISIPFLLMLVFGVVMVGRLFAQVTWLVQTSYEGVFASAQEIEYTGKNETVRIKQMFETELNDNLYKTMQGVSLSQVYVEESNVPLVRVGLSGDIFPVIMMGVAGLSVEMTGPHIGSGYGISGGAGFATLQGPYDCNGAKCGGGGEPSCPTNPC